MRSIVIGILFLFSVSAYCAGQEPLIIDVRSAEEYKLGHIEGALHQPYDRINTGIIELLPDKSRHLILYCGRGVRADIAKTVLEGLGYTHVENGGGYEELKARLAAQKAAASTKPGQ
jgi:phage shock protein E